MERLSEECQLIVRHILKRTDQYNMNQNVDNQISVTINRIQKILYLAQVEHIKHNGTIMFEDDFYALPVGPEIIGVRKLYMDYSIGKQDTLKFPKGKLNPDKKRIVDAILDSTNVIDNVTLSKCIRQMDNIWINTYRSEETKNNKLISKTVLINYYKPKNKPNTKKRAKRNARYYKQNTIM